MSPHLTRLDKLVHFKCIDDCADICCRGHVVIVPEPELQEKLKGYLCPMPIGNVNRLRRRGGYCVLLDENKKCSIQSDKPLACRAYPIFLDPCTNDVYADIKCPGIGQGDLLSEEAVRGMIENRRRYWELLGLTDAEREIVHKEVFLRNIRK